MNASVLPSPSLIVLSPELREQLVGRVRLVAPALRQRLGSGWSDSDVELVFLHYLYGLVAMSLPAAEPEATVDALRSFALLAMDEDAFAKVVQIAPPSGNDPLARAVIAAEELGRRDAGIFCRPILDEAHQTTSNPNP